MNQNEFIQYVSNCTEVFYDEPEPEAALIFARALLARAEADEAEVVDLHRQLVEMATAMEEIEAERLSLAARVAELEAQLAAQQWQPVTITEPSLNVMAELLIVGYRGHDGYWHYPDGPEGLKIRGWRPVPPSVALREPTP